MPPREDRPRPRPPPLQQLAARQRQGSDADPQWTTEAAPYCGACGLELEFEDGVLVRTKFICLFVYLNK